MLPRIMLLALLVYATPASAFDTTKLGQGGSLTLDAESIQALIGKSSQLAREIDQAVAKAGKKPGEIVCDGMRFPGAWKKLSGRRVSPYQCHIGERWLTIRARVRIFDAKGKLYQSITGKGMERADTVQESRPSWTWSDKAPN